MAHIEFAGVVVSSDQTWHEAPAIRRAEHVRHERPAREWIATEDRCRRILLIEIQRIRNVAMLKTQFTVIEVVRVEEDQCLDCNPGPAQGVRNNDGGTSASTVTSQNDLPIRIRCRKISCCPEGRRA